MKIYFDEKMANDFIVYAMERKARNEKTYKVMPYFTFKDVKLLAIYFAKHKMVWCTDKGQTFFDGEEYASTPTKICFLDGRCIDNRDKIIAYEKALLEEDRTEYIEEHLFHWIWCTIERILRCDRQNIINDYDKRILNKARKEVK